MHLAANHRYVCKFVLFGIITCLLISFVQRSISAQAIFDQETEMLDITRCFAVSDGYFDQEGVEHTDQTAKDTLAYLDRLSGATSPVAQRVPNISTYNIEAIAFEPGAERLYAANADRLGVLHLPTGTFTPRSNRFGNAQGYRAGSLTTVALNDVDSLSFDPTLGLSGGKLWGVNRNTGPDLLFQIDPNSGNYIAGTFSVQGTLVDFIEVQPQQGFNDIDDIAIDPLDGQMYAIMNQGGGPSNLVLIDPATGQTTDLGRFTRQATGEEIKDMEGLAFFNDGQLYGSTGKDWLDGRNVLWKIDKTNGVVALQGEFTAVMSDIEALDCLSAPAFIVVEKLLNGDQADTPPGVSLRQNAPLTWSYLIYNTGGLPLNNIRVTDDNGTPTDPTDDFVACVIDQLQPGETNQDAQGRISCTQEGRALLGPYHSIATVTATYVEPTTNLVQSLSHSDPAYYIGYAPPAIGNYVWVDTNRNGLQDPFEPPVPNVKVNLFRADSDELLASQITDENGFYLFDNLTLDNYYLEFDLSATLFNKFTVNTQGTDRELDSDVIPNGQNKARTPRFSVSANTTDTSWDAGVLAGNAQAELGDLVWHDRNGNGLQDPDEPGVRGVQVQLRNLNNAILQSETTDSNGRYRITDLTPGDYTLQITPPAGYHPTLANMGQNDNIDSDIQCSSTQQSCNATTQLINLSAGESDLTQDAGLWQPATINGQIWHDLDADGLRDADDEPRPEIVVALLDATGRLQATTTTDEAGRYTFADLPPATYRIQIRPDDLSDLQISPTTDDNRFSPATNQTEPLTLLSNESIDDIDAALFTPQAELQLTIVPTSITCDPSAVEPCKVESTIPVGTVVRYLYQVANPGNQPLTDVELTDEDCSPLILAAGDTNDNSVLDADETWIYRCDAPLIETTTVTAQVRARPLNDHTAPTLEDESSITVLSIQPSFTLQAMPSDNIVQPGDEITLAYEIDNSGDAPLTPPQFTELSVQSCQTQLATPQSGDVNNNNQIDPGETWRYRCQVTINDDAQITTVVEVQDPTGRPITQETVTIIDVINPLLGIEVEATPVCDATTSPPCDPALIEFSYTVENPGDDPITNLSVEDTACQSIQFSGGDIDADNQLDPGERWRYRCEETTENLRVTSQATITGLDSQGQTITDNDTFRLQLSQPKASLGDRVWEDLNRNGLQDPGEPGLIGITMRLLDSQDRLHTTTTDPTGRYTFDDLFPGKYRLFVVKPNDYEFTLSNQSTPEDPTEEERDSDVGADGSANPFPLSAGQNETDMDAGLVLKPAMLGDFVWLDENSNGLQDPGEPGVVGIEVQLWGVPRGDNAVQRIDTTVTDVAGRYHFENLDPTLTYVIEFVLPTGRKFTKPNQTSSQPNPNDQLVDSDVNPENGRTEPFVLTAGQHKTSIDAGILRPTIDISDRIWLDRNQDGIEAPNEPGVAGVNITLWLDGNQDGTPDTLVDSRITEDDGVYQFDGLDPDSTYFLQVIPNPDLDFTQTTINNPTGSTFDPDTGLSPPFTPTTNDQQPIPNLAAGLIPARASLGNRIWEDTDGDGVQGQPSREPGISGILVRLWRDNDTNGTPDEQVAATTSDGNGHYSFTDLDPTPNYFVEFVLPIDREPTLAKQGDAKLDSDATRRGCTTAELAGCGAATGPITLEAGEQDFTIDLGLLPIRFTINGAVWDDQNQNGIQEPTEPALQDVTVQLWIDSDNDGQPETPGPLLPVGGNGTYEAANLDPALVYFIQVKPNDGYKLTPESTVSPETGFSEPLRYVEGATSTRVNVSLEPLPASLTGLVWDDRNGDGIRDRNEPGVGNIQVALAVGDTTDNRVLQNVTTNPVGEYRIDNIEPGTYRIIFVSPTGIAFSPQNQSPDRATASSPDPVTGITPAFAVQQNETDQNDDQNLDNWNAGLVPAGNRGFSLESRVEGQDADTLDQALQANPLDKLRFSYTLINTGDSPISWVTLKDDVFGELTRACDLPIAVPADGEVTCTITRNAEDVPEGQKSTTTATVLNLGGQSDVVWYQTDGGYATIGDRVWSDSNQDGLQDLDEPGVDGIQVALLDEVGATVAETVTDEDGFYQFVGVEPSTASENQLYRILFTRPNNETYFTQPQATNDQQPNASNQQDSNANPSSGRTEPIEPSRGERIDHIDAGLYNLAEGKPGSIGNRVWEDLNGNGLQDEDEPGRVDVLVRLLDTNGQLLSTTLTDEQGNYRFTELAPASYVVEFVAPVNYEITQADQGIDEDTDSDPNPTTGKTEIIRLGLGENNDRVDAGLYRPVSIGNFVWLDEDGDGMQDQGEPGVEAVSVELYALEGTEPLATSLTNVQGLYLFDGLPPGEYYVIIQRPDDYNFTAPQACEANNLPAATCHLLDSDANPQSGVTQSVFVPSGEQDGSLDAGLITSLAISGRLWDDGNQDGLQSADELGLALPDVTVQLLDAMSGEPLAETVLDDSPANLGGYQFAVNPGNYQVLFTLPTGYSLSQRLVNKPTGQPTEPTLDSDPEPTTGLTPILIVEAGQSLTHIDAGVQRRLALGDFVWSDLDGNGRQDQGEPGIDGITIRLYDGNNELLATTQSHDGGIYEFTGLLPGDYQVGVEVPQEFQLTEATRGATDMDSNIDPNTARSEIITLNPATLQPCNSATLQLCTIDIGLIARDAAITLEKLTNGHDADEAPGPEISIGEPVVWEYIVTNVGQLPLSKIQIRDDQLGFVTDGCPFSDEESQLLEPGESITCRKEGIAEAGQYRNEAVVQGFVIGRSGDYVQDEDVSHYLGGGVDLAVRLMENEDPADAGSELYYTLVYTNNGPATARSVQIVDQLPDGVLFNQLISAEPELALPNIAWLPETGMDVVWTIDELEPNKGGKIVFEVDTDPSLNGDTIINRVAISSQRSAVSGQPMVDLEPDNNQSDEQTTFRLQGMGFPTAIELLDFSARPHEKGLEVRWVTAAEVNSQDFRLLRSITPNKENAVEVTPLLIKSLGDQGGEYEFLDHSALAGLTYYYWLLETEITGKKNYYGPINQQANLTGHFTGPTEEEYLVYLPLVEK